MDGPGGDSFQRSVRPSSPHTTFWVLVLSLPETEWAKVKGDGRGSPTGPCLRVSSQQGSRQQGLQSSHRGHCCEEAQQESRVPGTAGRRMFWTTVGQIHSHHHHKPVGKERNFRDLCLVPAPSKELLFAPTLPCLAYPAPRDSVSLPRG